MSHVTAFSLHFDRSSLTLGGPSSTSTEGVNYGSIFLDLTYTVVIPLVVGQLLRFLLPTRVEWLQSHVKFGVISNICLLFLVWAAFCDTFASGATSQISGRDMVVVIMLEWMLFFACKGLRCNLSIMIIILHHT